MRFLDSFLIAILCIAIATAANADDMSWSVQISDASPFARLTAASSDEELLSIACVKSTVTGKALKEYRGIPLTMKESDSIAMLVPREPTEHAPAMLNFEFLHQGNVMMRILGRYVSELGAYIAVSGGADFLGYLEQIDVTAIRYQASLTSGGSSKPVDVDFPAGTLGKFVSMSDQHCSSSTASVTGLANGSVAQGGGTETIDWAAASGWPSTEGVFVLLRHWDKKRLVTQLLDGSGRAPATLTTLDEKKTTSPFHDFLIDAGNRYFFRAPHKSNASAVASMTYDGELSLFTTVDSFSGPLKDAAALGDAWVLAAGGLFRLSANNELSNLSTSPASGSFPAHLISVGDRVLYVDRHPEFGIELFATDGTSNGTGMVLDINDQEYGKRRTRGSGPRLEHAAQINNRVVFTATDGSIPSGSSRDNFHLWSSDGTAEGTLRLPTDGFYSNFSNFIQFEGRLYVTARPRGNQNGVLYSTDGTPAGTRTLASSRSLLDAAGGDPERSRGYLGEPTKVGNRLIVPLLGAPFGRERGNPLFEVAPSGELNLLCETRENLGDFSGRLRHTGLSAGGQLLYPGVVTKQSITIAGQSIPGRSVSTVIRAVDPDGCDTNIIHELAAVERVQWLPDLPQRLPAVDAVTFVTQISSAANRNIIVTDGTAAGTRALSQAPRVPKVSAVAFSDGYIIWLEHDVFYSFNPNEGKVRTLFDPATTGAAGTGNAILGTLHLQ
jgi:ELWxxDGT repeat protein